MDAGLSMGCPGPRWSAPPPCRRSAMPSRAWSPISTLASYDRAVWSGSDARPCVAARLIGGPYTLLEKSMTDIAYLEAYVAISQVKAQYCRGLDTKDWVAYGDVFTDDVELDTRPAGGA